MTLTNEPVTVESPTPQPPRRSLMPQLVVGGVLVLIGLLWLVQRLGWVDLTVTAVLGLATVVTGVALMILARDGAHVGLIVVGSILGLLALVTAVAPFEGFQGGVGDRSIVIDSVGDMENEYNLAMGKLVIDLTRVDDASETATLRASVGTGELIVIVPDDIEVGIEASVGAGQIEIFDRIIDGVGVDQSYETPGFDEATSRLGLTLDVFAGRVEVRNG